MSNLYIKGIEGMTLSAVELEVKSGAQFVVFQFCYSLGIITIRRSSDVYFIRLGQSAWKKGLSYTGFTCIAGWWGFPWGFIYTPSIIYRNLKGGKNVTQSVMEYFHDTTSEYAEMEEMPALA